MKHLNILSNSREPTWQPRNGATLTEVLMAILIMGIGMIGVISLFPAAVLRSVHAHALTTSANLRFNAEAALALYPQILANPDRQLNAVQFHQQQDQAFMVDPLGLLFDGKPDGSQLGGNGTLRRFKAGFLRLDETQEVFSCVDKWTIRYEGFPVSGSVASTDNPQSLTFSDLSNQQIDIGSSTVPARLVIFNKLGDRCQVRILDTTNNPTILLNNVAWSPALPPSYAGVNLIASDIGKVRVEQRELTFTWLLTAKRQTSNLSKTRYSTQLAMFHKRAYSPTDLEVYTNSGDFVFKKGSNTVNIAIPTGSSPFLKRGGYVLDSSSTGGTWYRIQEYVESSGQATITLDVPAIDYSKSAVFMKGIVAVFRINDSNVSQVPLGYDTD